MTSSWAGWLWCLTNPEVKVTWGNGIHIMKNLKYRNMEILSVFVWKDMMVEQNQFQNQDQQEKGRKERNW